VRKAAWLFPALLALSLPSVGRAEVMIGVASRVPNLPSGRCGWCALETLARHHGIKALYGIADRQPPNCRPRDLEAVVTAANVKYRIQSRGCRSTELLQYAMLEQLGAVVGFRPLVTGGKGHIVTLVDFGQENVRFLDPNDTDGYVRTLDLEAFLQRWDGFALVLERP
jgi:ABC-type bacteriocin/lantibiotic exporter with double-glycine peptidase domain